VISLALVNSFSRFLAHSGRAMPYRFKLDESVRKGFRRIAREQIDLALGELSSGDVPAAAVHESRKALKRLRALIRCCAPALGAKAARKHNAAIRDIGRMLSGRRDADVMLETVAKLENRFGAEGQGALRPLRSHIETVQASAMAPLDVSALEKIRAALLEQRKQLGKVAFKNRGLDRIMDGIQASYNDGRRALKAAYKAPSDAGFHELRKAVQTHWRQMTLLARVWPEEFAVRAAAARELSQTLGDDHDIAMLKLAAESLAAPERNPIRRLCTERQSELRDTVFFRAKRLYAEKPAAFRSRMIETWKTGRRIRTAAAAETDTPPVITVLSEAHPASEIGSQPRLAAKTPVPAPSQRRA
jgi:CHAD domain-containing protein